MMGVCSHGALAAFVIVGLLVRGTVTVEAHAVLVETTPASSSRLERSPRTIRLLFNERVEPLFNSVRVLDREGRRYEQGRPAVTGGGSGVEIDVSELEPGSYTVVWRVNSIDGHQVQGHFGFGVQASPPEAATMRAAAIVRPSRLWHVYVAAWRAAALIAVTVWLGSLAFLALVLPPRTWNGQHLLLGAGMRLERLAVSAGVGFLVAAAVVFWNHAAVLADVTLPEALNPAIVSNVLARTNYGLWWSVGFLSAILLAGWSTYALRPTMGDALFGTWLRRGLAAVLAGVVLLGWPLTGHAGALRERTGIAVAVDWLHLVATVTWAGGVVALALTAVTVGRDTAAAAAWQQVPRRFSRVALGSVLVLAATGLYNAFQHVPSLAALPATRYGQILLAKLFVFALILLVAAVNRRRVNTMRRPPVDHAPRPADWPRRLRATVRAEAALLISLLVLVVWLTSVPPAAVAGSGGHFEGTREHRLHRVALTIHPAKVGTNHMTITIARRADGEPASIREATIFVRPLDTDGGLQTIEATPAAAGTFTATVVQAFGGRALVSVQVTPSDADAFVVEYDVQFSM